MRRSSLSAVSASAVRLLRAVPRPAGLALAAALGAAGLVAGIPAGPASAASGACTTSGTQVTCTFTETGNSQTWTVPAGVNSATFTLYGAEGGSAGATGPAGVGAEVTAKLEVTPGTVLQVNVGQAGGAGIGLQGISPSFGGGGAGQGGLEGVGGAGGGGASDIRTPASDGTYPLANRLLVAGGGGGGGGEESTPAAVFVAGTGGTGGNADGAGGGGGTLIASGATFGAGGGGKAGTTMGPGDGGSAGQFTESDSCEGIDGAIGNPGVGADGGSGDGAGGGGYYGGGGGGNGATGGGLCPATGGGGGGGGGSSYPAADLVGPTAAPGQSGNGEVIISFAVPPLKVTTTSLPAATGGQAYTAPGLAATGGIAPYSWSVPPGTLPPGLSLSTAGVISGIPDVAGTYTITVKVTDAENPAMTATKTLSITVSGPVISKLRPDHGFGGSLVEITGTGLSCPRFERFSCRVSVSFGGHRAFVLFASPTAIWVIAPHGHGMVQVTVTVGGVSSQATTAGLFAYQPLPFPL